MSTSNQPGTGKATDPAGWVDRHGDALYRFALLRLRDPEQAEDVVQECFTAALTARDRFSGQSSERTWLVGILKNKIIDLLRKKTRDCGPEEFDEADEELNRFFSKRGLWSNGPSRWRSVTYSSIESGEFWSAFRNCLDGLSPRLANVFVLRELEQMNTEEICEVQGVTPTNLWARLHRARLGLRQCLESTWFAK